MATVSGTFSTYPTILSYRVTADEVGVDTPNNRSLVRVRAFIDFTGGSASSDGGSGTTTAGNWSRGATSFSGADSLEVYAPADFYVNHAADGTGSYSFSGTASMLGWGSASTGTGVLTLTTINVAAGKRWSGSAWTDMTVNKRWTGSAWTNLTIKRRWSGSAWVDMS